MLPSHVLQKFESELAALYEQKCGVLSEAMRYSLLAPGKRLRPSLTLLSAIEMSSHRSPDDVFSCALPAMLSVEMVHCYSLVHDDLPAMDNDDYRRGRLSCHKKFGHAVGILVGDALLSDAFLVLSRAKNNALLQIQELSLSIGSDGMVLGQHHDLAFDAHKLDFDAWLGIHALKTGRLFEASCVMGALSVETLEPKVELMRLFARAFGIGFQLKDDLEDDSLLVQQFGRARVLDVLNQKAEEAQQLATRLESSALSQVAFDLRLNHG